MKDLDLTTLRLFVSVCDAKSIKRVAEREKVDASAITKRLAKLEAQLETPLLNRVRQGVHATPEGALLCEQARRLVQDAQSITKTLMQHHAKLAGVVTVASNMNSMASVLTDDLATFMSLHSNQSIQLNVKEMLSKDVVQTVRDGLASLGVLWDNTETSGLQHVDYYNDTVAAVMHKNHPLANRTDITLADMFAYDLVADKHSLHSLALLQRLKGSAGPNARFVAQVETVQSAIRMAEKGVGIYGSQIKVAQTQARNMDIAIVPLREKWARLRMKIIYQSNLLNPVAKRLIEHLTYQHQGVNPS